MKIHLAIPLKFQLRVTKMFKFSINRFNLVAALILLLSACNSVTQPEGSNPIERLTDLSGNESRPVFSPNGQHLLFTSDHEGPEHIYLFSFDTKQIVKVSFTSGRNIFARWSPDSQYISYTSDFEGMRKIIIYSLANGESKTLTEGAYANWSPDGTQLVYEKPTENSGVNLWLWDLPSQQSSELTNLEGNENNFGWSYDGSWIGFNSRASSNQHLHAINVQSREVRQLVGDRDGHEWHSRWSTKEDKVLFYTTWNQEMTDIWTTTLSDQSAVQITKSPIEEYGPVWNKDESLIAFFSQTYGSADIHIHEMETGKESPLHLHQLVGELTWTPLHWSPNANILAVVANSEKDQIYTLNIDSRKLSKLIEDDEHQYHPEYDKSGEFLAYQVGINEIRILNRRENTTVTISPELEERHQRTIWPKWSPDGKKIAYINGIGGAVDTNELWVANSDGSDQHKITHSGGIRNIIWASLDEVIYAYDSSTNYTFDIWSLSLETGQSVPLLKDSANVQPTSMAPDGASFLFFGDFDGKNKIYSMSLEDGKYQEIPNELEYGSWPVYSPDGQYIAFLSNHNDEKTFDIYVMPATGGSLRRLTNDLVEETDISWSHSGEEILFSANYGNQDIWLVDVDEILKQKDEDK